MQDYTKTWGYVFKSETLSAKQPKTCYGKIFNIPVNCWTIGLAVCKILAKVHTHTPYFFIVKVRRRKKRVSLLVKNYKVYCTWNPSNVQLANFMEQTCWSNGKYSTSMKHEDLKIAELSHVTPPSEEIITLVLNIPTKYSYYSARMIVIKVIFV